MPIFTRHFTKQNSPEDKAKSDEESVYGDGSPWPFHPTIRFLTDLMKLRKCGKASADADHAAYAASVEEYTKTLCDDTQMDDSLAPESSTHSSNSPTDETEGFREPRFSQLQLSPNTCNKRKYVDENIEKSVKKYKRTRSVEEQLLKLERERLKLLASNTAAKEDSDLQFLKSLLPYFKATPAHRKLSVRQKIQQVLLDEEQLNHASTLKQTLLRPKLQKEFQDEKQLNTNSTTNQPRLRRKQPQVFQNKEKLNHNSTTSEARLRHKLQAFEDEEQLNLDSTTNKPRLRRKLQKVFENEENINHKSTKTNLPLSRQKPKQVFEDEEPLNHNSTTNKPRSHQETQQDFEDEEQVNHDSTADQPLSHPKEQEVSDDEEQLNYDPLTPTQSPLPQESSRSIEETCLTVASSTHSSDSYLSPNSVSSPVNLTPLYHSTGYQQVCSIRSTSSYLSF